MFSNVLDAQNIETSYPPYITDNLPRSRLGYATNNQFPIFPPMMKDGRSLISSWNAETNEYEIYKKEHEEDAFNMSPLSPNWAYRRMMQKNGYELMAQNFVNTANDSGTNVPTGESMFSNGKDRNAPYIFNSLGDDAQPTGYQSSDLKDLYLSREQLNSRLYAPRI